LFLLKEAGARLRGPSSYNVIASLYTYVKRDASTNFNAQ
jgi:hypothetical protein